MPKFPQFAERVKGLSGSIFERYSAKMRKQGSNLVKMHIGDTYLHPEYPLPLDAAFTGQFSHFNQYCNTFGVGALREALVDKVREDNFDLEGPDNLMVTAGGSNALAAAMMALVEPGEEVIVPTPAWPLFFGMVQMAGARAVEAPLYMALYDNPDLDLDIHLEQYLSPRTVALYVNTPNNPSGKVLNRRHQEQLASFAERHGLWLIADEAYDGLTYDGHQHISIAGMQGMAERTLTVFTFSKVFMFAGVRLGYITGSADAIRNVNKALVHQIYSAQTPGQQMLIRPVQTRHDWMKKVERRYRDLRGIVLEEFDIPFHAPEGGYFIFFPVAEFLGDRDYWQLIEECLDAGVALAPGQSFGRDYELWLRLCFTGEEPERLRSGLQRLRNVLLSC